MAGYGKEAANAKSVSVGASKTQWGGAKAGGKAKPVHKSGELMTDRNSSSGNAGSYKGK